LRKKTFETMANQKKKNKQETFFRKKKVVNLDGWV